MQAQKRSYWVIPAEADTSADPSEISGVLAGAALKEAKVEVRIRTNAIFILMFS
jgi:hypothetical protein